MKDNHNLYEVSAKQRKNSLFRIQYVYGWTHRLQKSHGSISRYKCIDSYLRKHNREYAEDFASHLLRVNRFDLKIAQDFHIKIKNTLQLNVNILNFGNLLNNSWWQTKSIAASNWRGDIALQKNETENRPMFSMNTLAKIQKKR